MKRNNNINSLAVRVLMAAAALVCHSAAFGADVTGDRLKIGVSGGANQILTGTGSSIAGGDQNETDTNYDFIGGGYANWITDQYGTIGGGQGNTVSGEFGIIGGGAGNWIEVTNADHATIGGGYHNYITNSYGFIGGGADNTINGEGGTVGGGYWALLNGDYTTIAGGAYNTANGQYSAVLGGEGAVTASYGQYAHANAFWFNGGTALLGSAQASEFVLFATTTNNVATEMFLDNSLTKRMLMPTNGTWTFDVMVSARSANGNSGGFRTNAVIKAVSGTTTFVGGSTSVAVPVIASDVGAWSVTANVVSGTLAIKVTGDSSTNRWVATVHTSEVSY